MDQGEAGCYRQVAALYSDHYTQVTGLIRQVNCIIQYNTTQHNTMLCNIIQHNTIYNTTQHNIIQHDTTQSLLWIVLCQVVLSIPGRIPLRQGFVTTRPHCGYLDN